MEWARYTGGLVIKLTEAIADNVAGICHAAVPCIASIELVWGSYIQEEISKGSLKSVESEVKNIEGDDSEYDSDIVRLIDAANEHG